MKLLTSLSAAAVLTALLAGCAPYVDPKAKERAAREGADVQTGSNLPRRDKTAVVTVDKDAMQEAMQGVSRGVKSN